MKPAVTFVATDPLHLFIFLFSALAWRELKQTYFAKVIGINICTMQAGFISGNFFQGCVTFTLIIFWIFSNVIHKLIIMMQLITSTAYWPFWFPNCDIVTWQDIVIDIALGITMVRYFWMTIRLEMIWSLHGFFWVNASCFLYYHICQSLHYLVQKRLLLAFPQSQ